MSPNSGSLDILYKETYLDQGRHTVGATKEPRMIRGSNLSDTFFLLSSQTIDTESSRITRHFLKLSDIVSLMATFLTLPYEIRHEIYLQLVTTDRGIDPLMRILSPADARLNLHLSILRVCKAVHREAISVLLNHNHFVYQTDENFWHRKQYPLFHFYFTAAYGPPYEPLFKTKLPILPYLHLIRHLDFRIGGFLDSRNLRKILRPLSASNLTLKTLSIETWGVWHSLWIQRMLKTLERITVSRNITITANEREFIIGYDRMDAFWNTNISQFEEKLAL